MALPYQSPVAFHGLECFGVHVKAAGDLGWQAQRVLFELRPMEGGGVDWLDRAKMCKKHTSIIGIQKPNSIWIEMEVLALEKMRDLLVG